MEPDTTATEPDITIPDNFQPADITGMIQNARQNSTPADFRRAYVSAQTDRQKFEASTNFGLMQNAQEARSHIPPPDEGHPEAPAYSSGPVGAAVAGLRAGGIGRVVAKTAEPLNDDQQKQVTEQAPYYQPKTIAEQVAYQATSLFRMLPLFAAGQNPWVGGALEGIGDTLMDKATNAPGADKKSVIGQGVRGAVTMGPLSFVPEAKGILQAIGVTAFKQAAVTSVAGALYDAIVNQKMPNAEEFVKDVGGNDIAFAVMNAITHGKVLPIKKGDEKAAEPVKAPADTTDIKEPSEPVIAPKDRQPDGQINPVANNLAGIKSTTDRPVDEASVMGEAASDEVPTPSIVSTAARRTVDGKEEIKTPPEGKDALQSHGEFLGEDKGASEGWEPGFLNDTGNFLNRTEAAKLMPEAGVDELHSENARSVRDQRAQAAEEAIKKHGAETRLAESRADLTDVTKKLKVADGIAEIVDNLEDIPKDVLARRNSETPSSAYYDDVTGKTYFIASKIPKGKAEQFVVHELIHRGLDTILKPEQKADVLKNCYLNESEHEAELNDVAKSYGFDLKTEKGKLNALEELATKIWSEKAVEPGRWKRFVNGVADALKKLGIGTKWSEDEFEKLINEAIKSGKTAKAKAAIETSNGTITPPGGEVRSMVLADHGSPHDFEPEEGAPLGRFRKEKVGTGEGAAAYGWGVAYVAQERKVAEGYAKALASTDRKRFDNINVDDSVKNKLRRVNDRSAKDAIAALGKSLFIIKGLRSEVDKSKSKGSFVDEKFAKRVEVEVSSLGEAIKYIKDNSDSWERKGNVYHTELQFDPEDCLHWDKPLNEQSGYVKAALRDPAFKDFAQGNPSAAHRGSDIYGFLIDHFEEEKFAGRHEGKSNKQRASEHLASLGIKGIRYADEQSRGEPASPEAIESTKKFIDSAKKSMSNPGISKEDKLDLQHQIDRSEEFITKVTTKTHNYVVFNEDDIKIIGKNGQMLTPTEAKAEQAGGGEVRSAVFDEEARRRAHLAGAEQLKSMSKEERENTDISHPGWTVYEANKIGENMPEGKVKKVTDSNSFDLHSECEAIIKVDGKIYLLNKDEDIDDPRLKSWSITDPEYSRESHDTMITTKQPESDLIQAIREMVPSINNNRGADRRQARSALSDPRIESLWKRLDEARAQMREITDMYPKGSGDPKMREASTKTMEYRRLQDKVIVYSKMLDEATAGKEPEGWGTVRAAADTGPVSDTKVDEKGKIIPQWHDLSKPAPPMTPERQVNSDHVMDAIERSSLDKNNKRILIGSGTKQGGVHRALEALRYSSNVTEDNIDQILEHIVNKGPYKVEGVGESSAQVAREIWLADSPGKALEAINMKRKGKKIRLPPNVPSLEKPIVEPITEENKQILDKEFSDPLWLKRANGDSDMLKTAVNAAGVLGGSTMSPENLANVRSIVLNSIKVQKMMKDPSFARQVLNAFRSGRYAWQLWTLYTGNPEVHLHAEAASKKRDIAHREAYKRNSDFMEAPFKANDNHEKKWDRDHYAGKDFEERSKSLRKILHDVSLNELESGGASKALQSKYAEDIAKLDDEGAPFLGKGSDGNRYRILADAITSEFQGAAAIDRRHQQTVAFRFAYDRLKNKLAMPTESKEYKEALAELQSKTPKRDNPKRMELQVEREGADEARQKEIDKELKDYSPYVPVDEMLKAVDALSKGTDYARDYLGRQNWGSRKAYYMNEMADEKILSDSLDYTQEELAQRKQRGADLGTPSDIKSRTKEGEAKEGNLIDNVRSHITRGAVGAATLEHTLKIAEAINNEKKPVPDYLRKLYIRNLKNVAGHAQDVNIETKALEAGTKLFWWTFPASISRSIAYTARNFANIIGVAPTHIRSTEFIKGMVSAASQMKDPHSDVREWQRGEGKSVVNQAVSLYQQIGTASPVAGKLKRGVEYLSNFVMNFADVSSRGPTAFALYESARNAMADLKSGKITKADASKKLLMDALTPLETGRLSALMDKAVSSGDHREFSDQYARYKNAAINHLYEVNEKSLIEGNRSTRPFISLMTWSRSLVELLYHGGVENIVNGYQAKDYSRAWTGMRVLATYYAGMYAAQAAFSSLIGNRGKDSSDATFGPIMSLKYAPGSPGLSYMTDIYHTIQAIETLPEDSEQRNKILQKSASWIVDNGSHMIPLVESLPRLYDAVNDTKGSSNSRILWHFIYNDMVEKGYTQRTVVEKFQLYLANMEQEHKTVAHGLYDTIPPFKWISNAVGYEPDME